MRGETEPDSIEIPSQAMQRFSGGDTVRTNQRVGRADPGPPQMKEHVVVYGAVDPFAPPFSDRKGIVTQGFIVM
jgi:hypothetical protein